MCNSFVYVVIIITSTFIFQTQRVLNSPRVFSRLRHVQIMLMISYEDHDKILYIVSFLRVAPLIERLEVHVSNIPELVPLLPHSIIFNLHADGN